jgi:hypothetical protein
MEQQGQIVEDSYRGDRAALAVSPFRPSADLALTAQDAPSA